MNKFDFENFGFVTEVYGQRVSISIGKTEKHEQFNSGEGGRLSIYLLDKVDTGGDILSLWNVMSEGEKEKTKYLRTAGVSGADKEVIKRTLQILKSYLERADILRRVGR